MTAVSSVEEWACTNRRTASSNWRVSSFEHLLCQAANKTRKMTAQLNPTTSGVLRRDEHGGFYSPESGPWYEYAGCWLQKLAVELPVFVRLDLDVDPMAEDAGKQVVVELPLYRIGIPGVEDEFANSRNRGGGDEERLAIGLEDFADVALDAFEVPRFRRDWENRRGWCRSWARRWRRGVRSR